MSSSASFYSRLQSAQREHGQLQDAIAQQQRALQHCEARMTNTLQQIRTVVIEAIRNGERFDWTEADEQVSVLFKQLYERHDDLTEQLQRDEAEATRANEAVRSALAEHEAAVQALAHLDQHIHSATEALPAVQDLRQQQDDIELLTERLKSQKADAETEAGSKRIAYESDRYFQYLWRRGYGTPRYQAGRVGARLDRWLAEACYYNDNQRQYELLLAVPLRLQSAIAESVEQLAALEGQIAAERARVANQMQREQLQAKVDASAAKLADCKQAVANVLQRMQAGKTEVGSIQGGVHTLHERMATLVDQALDNQQLKRFVGATLSTVDDKLFQHYEQDRQQVQALRSDNARLATQARSVQNDIEELNSAWQRAKMLEAAAIAAAAARRSNRSHGGMFGGGGFGGGGFGGGGFGGGGFSSGGGFGGGGFRTGGGF